jgi:protein farnesyltransferase/geranylgeranyltransferase type-1 subunit alpha
MDSFSGDNPKNYQIWYHRRSIASRTRDGARELAFTARVFEIDAKNYHAWAHRQWVILEFGLSLGELEYLDSLLAQDIRNNSVWNQRWFIIERSEVICESTLLKEVDFVFHQISVARDNESAWNYLRGLYFSNLYSSVINSIKFEELLARLTALYQQYDDSNGNSRLLYSLIVDVCDRLGGAENIEFAEALLQKLEVIDVIRIKYWRFCLERLQKNNRKPVITRL